MKRNKSKTAKKLSIAVVAVIVMTLCLAITTFAQMLASVSVSGNTFQTGTIEINLNDGKPVINPEEFLFEPGMTVEKDFFLKNDGTDAAYYRIYFEDVKGEFADVIQVTVEDGDTVVFEGILSQMTKDKVGAADQALAVGERRDFTITFWFPKEEGNNWQTKDLSFEICADAVQTKNNPNALFQ